MSHSRALIVGLGYSGGVTAHGHSWPSLASVDPDVKAIDAHLIARGYGKKDIIRLTDGGGLAVSGGDIVRFMTCVLPTGFELRPVEAGFFEAAHGWSAGWRLDRDLQ